MQVKMYDHTYNFDNIVNMNYFNFYTFMLNKYV